MTSNAPSTNAVGGDAERIALEAEKIRGDLRLREAELEIHKAELELKRLELPRVAPHLTVVMYTSAP